MIYKGNRRRGRDGDSFYLFIFGIEILRIERSPKGAQLF